MYPATIFNWHDQSQIQTASTSTVIDNSPLLMQVFSADKGTEDLIEISGTDFDAMYGTMSFTKHGQSAIQAKAIIDAGGRLYAKRVVANDATLANAVLCANVSVGEDNSVTVKWSSQAITNCKSFAEVRTAAEALLDEASGVYPLIIYTDNGRGVSGKAVRLNPDYATSKTIGKTFYTLSVYEGTTVTESTTVSFDPSVVYNDTAYRLDEYTTTQISGLVLDAEYELYAEALAQALLIDVETLRTYDIVYGYTNRGSAIPNFNLDAEGVDLDAETGVPLTEGSNGEFGDAPANTDAWTNAIVDVFTGAFDTSVYDLDTHKLAAVVDANYPKAVKDAIFDFVAFRKDCVFLRDYGTGLSTYLEIKEKHDSFDSEHRNYFTADYCTSYMIRDPQTKKNIEVTCTYDMASVIVGAIANNPFAPLAGIANGIILENAIEGSVNFTPVNTPAVNQLEAMEELGVNYAIFHEGRCVMQSCYTSQEVYTQLSYISNVIAIQRVLRAVRTECPAHRYTLVSGADLSEYATAVNKVLANFSSSFSQLNFIYTQDELKTQQKIFYASIEFAFLNWAQTEIFDVYAINNN